MSKTTGLDRAVEYVEKLEAFRAQLESEEVGCVQHGHTVAIEKGRKFDKVFINTGNQRMGRYMVDRNSWGIYGIKSWAQLNPRRFYGSLDTITSWDWSNYYGTPKTSDAVKEHEDREREFVESYLPRGRPRKS